MSLPATVLSATTPTLQSVHNVTALRQAVVQLRANGQRIGFVPTMGALHAGHIALVRAARNRGEAVVASIFVNPTQFGPNEDLSRYPRTPEADLAQLAAAGASFVFMPTPDVMYHAGEDLQVRLPTLASVLEGASRPGHFDGVALVVAKLLNQVQPILPTLGRRTFSKRLSSGGWCATCSCLLIFELSQLCAKPMVWP